MAVLWSRMPSAPLDEGVWFLVRLVEALDVLRHALGPGSKPALIRATRALTRLRMFVHSDCSAAFAALAAWFLMGGINHALDASRVPHIVDGFGRRSRLRLS